MLGQVEALTVQQVQELVENHKTANLASQECPVFPHVMIYDISLKPKGHDEDVAYAQDTMLEKNIRRGNSIIEVFDKNDYDVLKGTYMARRGLMKFFDLRREYLEEGKVLSRDDQNLKNYILSGPYNAIQSGYQVEVLKTLKANGENVQISYCKPIDSWVIASKNVALYAKVREDIEKYKNQ